MQYLEGCLGEMVRVLPDQMIVTSHYVKSYYIIFYEITSATTKYSVV